MDSFLLLYLHFTMRLINFHNQIAKETDPPFTAREHLHRVLCEIFRVSTELGYITINPTFHTFKYKKSRSQACSHKTKIGGTIYGNHGRIETIQKFED